MKRVLITGMSGTGKSSVLAALAARGYKCVDTDYGEWSEVVAAPGARSGIENGLDWCWREDRMNDLLATEDAEILFVSGAAGNQGKFHSRFDHIILLTAPDELMLARLGSRTNNPYGKRPDERERVLELKAKVEPLLRRTATAEIDTSPPLDEVVARVLSVLV
jgi:dephospho-CoA kinase